MSKSKIYCISFSNV